MKKIMLVVLLLLCGLQYECADALAKDVKLTLTATASSVYSTSASYKASNAVDGLLTTYWLGAANASPWWIMFDAQKETRINRISIFWYSASYAPSDFDIQVSTDGATWQNVYAAIRGTYSVSGVPYVINRDARYVRLYIRTTYYYPVLSELEAYREIVLPRTIRFQGALKDSEGMPLDGQFTLTFRIYKGVTGGAAIWEEVMNSAEITQGLLDVELGSVKALDLPFDAPYWLGIEVGSDGEMTPRFKLTSVPYSFSSER